MKGYPKWFSRRFITLLMSILFLSGLFLIPTTLENQLEIQVPWRLEPSSRILVAGTHALFAFIAIALLGALWSIHMRTEWKRGTNRVSGLSLVLTFYYSYLVLESIMQVKLDLFCG